VSGADETFREMVPKYLMLPCERTDAVMSVPLVIGADPVLVYSPGLGAVKGALAVGSYELVRSYCELWTRFLAMAGSRERGQL
jgi:hypothetical protein